LGAATGAIAGAGVAMMLGVASAETLASALGVEGTAGAAGAVVDSAFAASGAAAPPAARTHASEPAATIRTIEFELKRLGTFTQTSANREQDWRRERRARGMNA